MNYHRSVLLGLLCPLQPTPTVIFPFSIGKYFAEVSKNMNIHDTLWTNRLLTEGCNCAPHQTSLLSVKYFIVLCSLVGLYY